MAHLSVFTPPSLANITCGDKQQWGGLKTNTNALAIFNALEQWQETCLFTVVTPDAASANQLLEAFHFFSNEKTPIYHLTDWETLPYDIFSPHDTITSTRLETLYNIQKGQQGILVVSMNTLMGSLPPVDYLQQYSFIIEKGEQIHLANTRRQLESNAYQCVDVVYHHGEFAIRGSLIDIYPMGSELPFRIDLFDDEVDSIRTFDPETQRSIQQVTRIHLLPAKEFPLDEKGTHAFLHRWHERFDVDHRQCPIYQDINNAVAPAGIEYYLPLFYDQCATLFDYLPKNTVLFSLSGIEAAGDHFWKEIHKRYDSRCGDRQRPLLAPKEVFSSTSDVFTQMKGFRHCAINPSEKAHIIFDSQTLPDLTVDHQTKEPFQPLARFIHDGSHRLLLCAESAGRRESLLELLKTVDIHPKVVTTWEEFVDSQLPLAIVETHIEQGFLLSQPNIAVITETELFGNQVKQRRRRKSSGDINEQMIKSLTELKIGMPVVHLDHGIGRYQGLQALSLGNDGQQTPQEFIVLVYADEAKLYVPVTHLHLISRYSGSDESIAPLHKLGSDHWRKAKEKAAKEIRDVAAELLAIYAKRDMREGFAYPNDTDSQRDYERFSAAFPFEETPDQEVAINAVRADMLDSKPMDRLVCGDVGFGKTEVAMRAAFTATHAGKQVAVLVPTTLLAQQHYENFLDRFVDWPITIDVVSRFRSAADIKKISEGIRSGSTDIIIGTHKILSSDFDFKLLGLLIIDEEHRFGVRQKEKIKALRSEVDILTLTATPIPRTLNMAMHNIRDLSIIATPPARRLSIKTFVRRYDDSLIKEAVLRELFRGGQVYFLHNEVKSIEKTARDLEALIPEARVGVAHGQLREKALEQVMSDFYHQKYNVLACSTIIETGIDIPNANTIIIERADKFGLAQLHQLRGRVGRSHHQAYAYLLTPPPNVMTADAEKRLEAISQADDLGAGFTLATHDLEIRGAGELLGDEQSGQMQSIGFTLYMEMLEQTIKAVKEGKTLQVEQLMPENTDINLHIPALIPEEYMPDVHTRLLFYKRLSALKDERGLRELQVELIDRFGLLPEPLKHLVRVTRIKQQAETIGITKIDANAHRGQLDFSNTPNIDPLTIIKMVQNQPQIYQLRGANQLVFQQDLKTAEERLTFVETLLEALVNDSV